MNMMEMAWPWIEKAWFLALWTWAAAGLWVAARDSWRWMSGFSARMPWGSWASALALGAWAAFGASSTVDGVQAAMGVAGRAMERATCQRALVVSPACSALKEAPKPWDATLARRPDPGAPAWMSAAHPLPGDDQGWVFVALSLAALGGVGYFCASSEAARASSRRESALDWKGPSAGP
jgi:hypothetical protein